MRQFVTTAYLADSDTGTWPNYFRSECAAKLHTQPDPKGAEGFILPSVTAKVINPHRWSDYKNYLIRDVHSNDVLSLN